MTKTLGVSTKITAATLATAVLTIIQYVLFDATWGPQYPAFPEQVTNAIFLLVIFAAGYLVREQAVTIVEPKNDEPV